MKLTTISPIHIGSGQNYPAFLIHNNNVYNFDDVVSIIPVNKKLDQNFLRQLLEPKGSISNEEFAQKIGVQTSAFDNLPIRYKLDHVYSNKKNQVLEFIKTTNRCYIPGSSLKGYFINLMWHDIIKTCPYVRDYYVKIFDNIKWNTDNNNKGEIKRETKKFTAIEHAIQNVFKLINVQDLNFDVNPTIYNCSRFLKAEKNGSSVIPVGLTEIIDKDKEYNGNIFYTDFELHKEYCDKFLEKLIAKISKSKDSSEQQQVEITLAKEFFDRIKNFKTWFKDANKALMLEVLYKEEEFAGSMDNPKTRQDLYVAFLDKTKARINNGEMIFQLGKMTNYLVKSIGLAFGKDYYKYFKYIVKLKQKSSPHIATVNLIEENGLGTLPLGFVKLEF